jgi:hypothetical protein
MKILKKINIKFSYYSEKNKYITNLSTTIKEIVISDDIYSKFLTNIPFGTNITIDKKLNSVKKRCSIFY